MHWSQESENALLGLVYLARQPEGAVVTVGEIADKQRLPRSFLAKTFQKLARNGVLRSFRGRNAGYTLARPAGEVSLKDLLEVLEGRGLYDRCLFWNRHCADGDPCLMHGAWSKAKESLVEVLEETSLRDLSTDSR
jgi:Rrf2 family protein